VNTVQFDRVTKPQPIDTTERFILIRAQSANSASAKTVPK